MNRTRAWSIRRQTIRRSDAQTRWDQAYQHLLQWTVDREGGRTPEAPLAPQQEVADARRPLRPCLDQPTSPSANH
jgi:hypothetical protein